MLNHWNCELCKSYNDILNKHCVICKIPKPDWVTNEFQGLVEISRGIYFQYGIYGVNSMTEQEELFSKFYSHEAVLVKDMDDNVLREHREELQKIAFEAKARLTSVDEEVKERRKKNGKKEWELTPTGPDVNVTNAINAVKLRKDRMSKLDKAKQQLLAAGIDEDIVNEMVKNMEKKATEKVIKTISFKPDKSAQPVVIKVPEPSNNDKPFDASALNLKFFNKE